MNSSLKFLYGFFCFFLFGAVVTSCQQKTKITKQVELTKYVDPFIGTGGHGHTYPGATVPFGMVQVSPDNGISAWDWCSGYHYSDSIVIGFSQIHLSGTGIGDLADVRFMPTTKEQNLQPESNLTTEIRDRNALPWKAKYHHDKETATPGYYSINLYEPNILVELTADERTSYQRYTFEKDAAQSVVLDLGFAINWDKTMESFIQVEDEYTVSGYRHSKGWAANQKVFFVTKFSKPITKNFIATDGEQHPTAQLFFDNKDQVLLVKTSISSVSIENAKENMSVENNFESIVEQAHKKWQNTLSNITIQTPNDSLKTIFYTALYHTQVAPVLFGDSNGQARMETDRIATVNDFDVYSTLSLWDTFRTENPLLTITQPELVSDLVNTMLLYFENKQILPVWTLYANETNTMTGYHSIPVIAEAYFKGIKGFDVEKAYEAMKTTMMQDERGLVHYKKYGYIPYELQDESVTISLEYGYNDYCVAQMAKALGKSEDYDYFMNRSMAYKQLFDKETGFMRGKAADGKSWNMPFDPKYSNHREHTDYTEGNAWQHSWFVLHDVPGLIELHGGAAPFSQKLEQLFTESSEITGENVSADISGLIGQYAHGNEPSHHIAYMFNFAGQPWRTQYWVREILTTQYNATINGLSGNEDCGQMSAWYVMSAMGLYPYDPASANYQLTSPLFEKSTINMASGNQFTITAENVSVENKYIQSATLNGQTYNSTTISHEVLNNGGKLHFVLGATPNKNWGVNQNQAK